MELFGHSVLVLSLAGILWQLVRTRRRARNGEIIIPPLFAGLVVFSCCLIGVILLRVSPLHLLWLFPASYVVGTALLLVPFVQKFVMALLVMVALPTSLVYDDSAPVVPEEKRKRARKQPLSRRRKR